MNLIHKKSYKAYTAIALSSPESVIAHSGNVEPTVMSVRTDVPEGWGKREAPLFLKKSKKHTLEYSFCFCLTFPVKIH